MNRFFDDNLDFLTIIESEEEEEDKEATNAEPARP